jgi:hypothetical protein
VIAGALLAVNVALAAGLVALALSPRPVRVVPAARSDQELLPGVVPEAALREFALRYIVHFDNYTPGTIEASEDVLRRMISARTWAGASAALEKRRRVALEGKMSSQVIPLSARVAGLSVTVEAKRRTFISDKLSREAEVTYEVTLERQPPTDPNPFGLAVLSQVIHER